VSVSWTVAVVDQTDTGRGELVAADLGVALSAGGKVPDGTDWCVVQTYDGLELRENDERGRVWVEAELPRRHKVSRDDPLGRALGKGTQTVIDATAGLGTDMLLMIELGFSVTAIEESSLISVLLRDRLARSGRLAAQSVVHTGDATSFLSSLQTQPDVVYLDPMFPSRRRSSALPRKELVVLSKIAEPVDEGETDARALFREAQRVASNRVVVKRLPESPQLGGEPSHSHRSKALRYDVYLNTSKA